jgi:inositol hexakisphosphate/diphosphoinositol-pentakisphosphate kinase
MGGGRKRMFNKKINECSTFEPSSEIRRDTNYIYENFIPENGFIIKVYTVGVNYMYAEARKSPALDGIVFRNKDGKEARYPIILTPQEKFMCKKIVIEFEQEVCGIKLLRSEEGKSYILGVDGWSLAKSNVKYWEDCAYLLKKKLLNHFFPHQHLYHAPVLHLETENNYRPPTSEKNVKVEELRSIVIISRHADRSPKEKLKIKTKEKRFIALF